MAVVNLDETAVGRMKLEPGWRWSVDVAPKVGTASCQIRHLGAALSGHLYVIQHAGIVNQAYRYAISDWMISPSCHSGSAASSARIFL